MRRILPLVMSVALAGCTTHKEELGRVYKPLGEVSQARFDAAGNRHDFDGDGIDDRLEIGYVGDRQVIRVIYARSLADDEIVHVLPLIPPCPERLGPGRVPERPAATGVGVEEAALGYNLLVKCRDGRIIGYERTDKMGANF